MKILLACAAGMSTSLVVVRMQEAAKAKGVEAEILAMPVSQAQKVLNEWDVVLLGPQVRHTLPKMQDASKGTPIGVIEMRDYGMMDGIKILESAIKLVEENK